MGAALPFMTYLMEEGAMGPPRHFDDDDSDGHSGRSDPEYVAAKEFIAATVELSREVGKLAKQVEKLEERLDTEFTDNKTSELKRLRDHDRWFKRIVTAVVTAVAVAETLKWLHLDKFMGGG